MALYTRVFSLDILIETPNTCIRRIIINTDVLKAAKITTGDLLCLTSVGSPGTYSVGVAWPSHTIDPSGVQVSRSLALTAQASNGHNVRLDIVGNTRSSSQRTQEIVELQKLHVVPTGPDVPNQLGSQSSSAVGKRKDWLPVYLKETLVDIRYITQQQIIEIFYQGVLRQFKLSWSDLSGDDDDISNPLASGVANLSLNSEAPTALLQYSDIRLVGWDTEVILDDPTKARHAVPANSHTAVIDPATADSRLDERHSGDLVDGYSSVGGLDKQIGEIRDLVELPLHRPDLFLRFGLKPPRGVLLHGPPGTGKTYLARAIASSTKSHVIVINGPELSSAYHGETESKLRDVFGQAKRQSPCIVVLDELDALCPRRDDSGGEVEKRVVATMLTLLDGMQEASDTQSRVIVIGTTNRPNAIDPALRRPGRFDREIEIGIPDAPARLAILKILIAKIPHSLLESDLLSLASRTHGYVGADLSALVRDAGTQAIQRWLRSEEALTTISTSVCHAELTATDLLAAMSNIRPSAMREVFVETPQVRWSDIGGQAYVKEKLKECVEWPLLRPDTFARLGITPPKGVLLYGPPGCSKTLTAKALATESGINFLAVKGPELSNKYVGESERALREIFRKARAASPSIIFFDELDALGSARDSSEGRQHEGVLTTLLNEMDGIQELVGVTVVAATNRPDVIDSALMRPGRLDRILYVGPPDLDARVDILTIRTKGMAVDPSLDLRELATMTDGCSGAELVAMCQDAALTAMKENMDTQFVSKKHFIAAATGVRRQITPDMIRGFMEWNKSSGLRSA